MKEHKIAFPHNQKLVWSTLDNISHRIIRHGRDYLMEGRLIRRLKLPSDTIIALLRGYRDNHYPRARFTLDHGIQTDCSCGTDNLSCAHVAALLIDSATHPDWYVEVPWRIVTGGYKASLEWISETPFPWALVPDETPPWRLPFTDLTWPLVSKHLDHLDSRASLSQDRAAAIFAESHNSWLTHPLWQQAFRRWIDQKLAQGVQSDAKDWVLLAWCQPNLPLSDFWVSQKDSPRILHYILECLFSDGGFIAAEAERRRALLIAATLLDARMAEALWDLFPVSDQGLLDHADALSMAGHVNEAIALLETRLPKALQPRIQARQRLLTWLSLKDSVPHRLALSWETGSRELLEPIRNQLSSIEWQQIMKALDHQTDPSE